MIIVVTTIANLRSTSTGLSYLGRASCARTQKESDFAYCRTAKDFNEMPSIARTAWRLRLERAP